MFLIYVFVAFFVLKHPHTYDAFLFSKLRLALFSICNIQYFQAEKTTDIDYSGGDIEWGSRQCTVDTR